MYLLRNLYLDEKNNSIVIRNGIKVCKVENDLFVFNQFWGLSDILLLPTADYSQFEKLEKDNYFLLSYVTIFNPKHYVKNMGDGDIVMSFEIGEYNLEQFEGYIVFIDKCIGEIKTDGLKLFKKYPNKIVAVLKEGQSIEWDGHKVQVMDGELVNCV